MKCFCLFVLLVLPVAHLFAQEDCDIFNIQDLSAAYLNFSVDSIILQSDGSHEVHLSNGTTYTMVLGCIDPAYGEYDATANTDDGSCATFIVNGCTDPAYIEYDETANTDDGSCATLIVNGCMDPAYLEYDATANIDDGSCMFLIDLNCVDVTMDGHIYSVVQIGNQCWFAENLRTSVYADDSAIPEVTGNSAWGGLITGARCDYANNAANVSTYGRLYNWYAATNAAGLCPSGWHVPTDGEWTDLKNNVIANGHSGAVGTALKATYGWSELFGGVNGTDDFGFSALPGGYRGGGGSFNAGYYGNWWSSSPSGGNAWSRSMSFADIEPGLYRNARNRSNGYSVRCLRDAD